METVMSNEVVEVLSPGSGYEAMLTLPYWLRALDGGIPFIPV
jgi:hypothetical protein